jgi:hypothetical protein
MKFLHTATGLELMPGVVAVIQTFGDRINFHPHIHVLMTEGGTAPDGAFHHVSCFHDEALQKIFTHEVFSLLLRKKLIGLSLVRKILHRRLIISSRISWWQPRRVGSISEGLCGCFLSIRGRSLS